MRLNLSLALSVLTLGCATTGQNRQATMHDAEANASLEAFARTGMDQIAKGDISWWGRTACPQAMLWDADGAGNSTAASGKAEIDKSLAEFQKMMSSDTMQMTTTTNSIKCRSTSLSGHCLVEFDQSVTMNGKAMGPLKFRGTLIAERNGEGWIWTHWHGSLRPGSTPVAAPPAAAPPDAATPAPAAPTAEAAPVPAAAASAPAAPAAPTPPAAPVKK